MYERSFWMFLWVFRVVQGSDASNADFALRAEVVEALEGGPLVVKATLTYRGREAMQILRRRWPPNAHMEGPAGWRPWHPPIVMIGGGRQGPGKLSPGDETVEVHRLHEDYSGIAGGKTTVTVTWKVYSPGKNQELIANVAVPLEIDIPAATPERLTALRKRMEEQLRTPGLSVEDRSDLLLDIICTRHHALAPVAWQMIESPGKQDGTLELIRFISECPVEYPDLDARMAKMAANPDWAGAPGAFAYWNERKTDLPPAAWKTLTEAESVWTRALTYVTFPRRCGKEWKESLFQDLRDQLKPLPSGRFDRLLADLDDDDFDVREKASVRLLRFGERVEDELRRALDRPLSTEARQRVTAILDKVQKAKQPPECARALSYLRAHDAPEGGELLQVLAEGSPDAWLTQQAKAKLAEWRKARGLPDK